MTVLKIILIVLTVLIVLYFLAIMPRLGHKRDKEELMHVHYAHRGLHDNSTDAPENSMKAFQKAVKAGYGIELDVQLSKDRVPVVFHDFTLERACKKEGKVYDYTWDELKTFKLFDSEETIPRFEDVLSLVKGKVPLIVELKVEWLEIYVCTVADELLRNYKGTYCIESFNPLALLWYRRYHNNVIRGQLSDGFLKSGEFHGGLYFILQNLLLNWMTKPDFIAYNHKYADNLSRRLCHGFYRNLAVAWTIKSSQELEEAADRFDLFIFDSFIPPKKK